MIDNNSIIINVMIDKEKILNELDKFLHELADKNGITEY